MTGGLAAPEPSDVDRLEVAVERLAAVAGSVANHPEPSVLLALADVAWLADVAQSVLDVAVGRLRSVAVESAGWRQPDSQWPSVDGLLADAVRATDVAAGLLRYLYAETAADGPDGLQ